MSKVIIQQRVMTFLMLKALVLQLLETLLMLRGDHVRYQGIIPMHKVAITMMISRLLIWLVLVIILPERTLL